MWVGKHGTMQDGLLDVTLLTPAPLSRQLRDVRHLYSGEIQKAAGTIQLQASHVEILPDQPIPIELDGESPGVAPATFEILPRKLQIRGGWLPSPF